jgi:predicted DNA-binding antitoxin AbrB/MazE fold protein
MSEPWYNSGGRNAMSITVDATFENGQLKLKEPVVLAEGTPVRVTITPVEAVKDPFAGLIGICSGGPRDGAENHDKYIYGPKFGRRITAKKKANRRK